MEQNFNQNAAALSWQSGQDGVSRTKTYECSKKIYAYTAVIHWLIFFALALLAAVIAASIMMENLGYVLSGFGWLCAAAAAAAVAVPITVVYLCHCITKRIEINKYGITFCRAGGRCTHYPIDAKIRSSVQYEMGTPFADRSLYIKAENGREKCEKLKCFPKETLGALVADINRLREYGSFDIKGQESRLPPEFYTPGGLQAKFVIPKQRMMREKNMKRGSIPKRLGISLLAGIADAAIVCLMGVLAWKYYPLLALGLAAFVFILMAADSAKTDKDFKKCPECIMLFTDHIQIDSAVFPINVISRVTMSPPTYEQTKHGTSTTRYLTLYTQSGTAEYPLGGTTAARECDRYAQYRKLLESVKRWCFDHDIEYFDELE